MKKEANEKRILGRLLAKELSPKDLKTIAGGTTSCSPCADDCDANEF